MTNLFELIPQTNRTLLFAPVNAEKKDLYTMLSESVDEAKLKEIEENLMVKSFEDFLDKFNPTIYCNKLNNDGKLEFQYSLENQPGAEPIRLTKNTEVIKMLIGLIDQKNDTNISFDYEKILDLLSPEKLQKDIKLIKKELIYLSQRYNELPEGDTKRKEIGTQLTENLKNYKATFHNTTTHLTLIVEGIREKVRFLEGNNKKSQEGENKKLICQVTFDDEGNLKTIPIENNFDNKNLISQNTNSPHNLLAEKIEKVYEKDCENKGIVPNKFIKGLLVTDIQESNSVVEITDDIKKKHDIYCEILKKDKENYLNTIVPLLNTILGVKIFFDIYEKTTSDKKYKPALIISNCTADTICSPAGKKRLEELLKETNDKLDYSKTIWFSIIPNVSSDQKTNIKKEEDFGFETIETAAKGYGNCALDELDSISGILSKYKVTSFFNFIPDYNNSFTKIQEKWEVIRKKTERVQSEYLVNCLPNFTIVPEGKSFNLGTKLIVETNAENDQEVEIVKLPGIYVDASYVACGLVASYQSPEFLKRRFNAKLINDHFAGVRVDIEKGENRINLHTLMPIETTGYRNEFIEAVNKEPYGFLFASESFVTKIDSVKNKITVFKSRSLGINNGEYKPIYKPLIKTYIERIIKKFSNGIPTLTNVNKVIGNSTSSIIQDWKKEANKVNALINEFDSIKLNEKEIVISFAKNEEPLEIEIKEEN
jgi:hypothetical protein